MEMDKFKGIIKKVPIPNKIQEMVKTASGQNSGVKQLNKELDDKRAEMSKTYGLIGMEVYDLIKSQRADIPQVMGYIDKVDDLSAEIKRIEKNIELAASEKSAESRVCTCGCTLAPGTHFCPGCGAAVTAKIICQCGAELQPGAGFCVSCGKKVEPPALQESGAEKAPAVRTKKCICGADVPEDQFMCYECGRKVE